MAEKQIAWATRRGIQLRPNLRAGEPLGEYRGQEYRTAYTAALDDNLFEQMSDGVRSDFAAGDGGELAEKMLALYSSSALACNLFHHLKTHGLMDVAAMALGCAKPAVDIRFEQQRPIMENPKSSGFRTNPNLDVVLDHGSGQAIRETAVECKFIEPYRDKTKGIKARYLETVTLWSELPICCEFAKKIGSDNDDRNHSHLHASQLLKHLLGLCHRNGKSGFELVYLWYAAPGLDGSRHQAEIESFIKLVAQDGLKVRSVSVQEFVLNLWRSRTKIPELVDYLADRYL